MPTQRDVSCLNYCVVRSRTDQNIWLSDVMGSANSFPGILFVRWDWWRHFRPRLSAGAYVPWLCCTSMFAEQDANINWREKWISLLWSLWNCFFWESSQDKLLVPLSVLLGNRWDDLDAKETNGSNLESLMWLISLLDVIFTFNPWVTRRSRRSIGDQPSSKKRAIFQYG